MNNWAKSWEPEIGLKVQEVEDNISDQESDVKNEKFWSAFRCTCEITVGRGVLE